MFSIAQQMKGYSAVKKLRSILILPVFFAIGILLLVKITDIMIPKWTYTMGGDAGEGTRYRDFYKQSDDSLDYIVIGTSHTNYAINPMQIYEETGYTGYVLGGENQSMACSYYWLMEAERKNDLKAVFVDVSSLHQDVENGTLVLKELVEMRPSVLKIRAILDCSPDEDTLYSAFFPLYSFHERWSKLGSDNFSDVDESWYYLRGSALRFYASNQYLSDAINIKERENLTVNESGEVDVSKDYMGMDEKTMEYFEKIRAFCSENNIRMIPIKCPTRHWTEKWSEDISKYLNSIGSEGLVDMTDQADLRFDWDTDTYDDGFHMSYMGNSKTSHWFAAYLEKMGIFEDHRKSDEVWKDTAESYLQWERGCVYDLLHPRQRIYQYLSSAADSTDRYMVLVSVNNDMYSLYDEETDQLFRRIGFREGLKPEEQKALLAAADGGKELFLRSSFRKEEYNGVFVSEDGNEHSIKMVSSSANAGDESSIIVDGVEYSDDVHGVNMALVDRADGKVISRACFGYRESGELYFEEHKPDTEAAERISANNSKNAEKLTNAVLTVSDNEIALKPVYVEDCCYILKDAKSGKVLVPEAFGNTEGTSVTLQNENGLAAQQWTIFTDNDGNLRVLSLFADKYLSEENGNFKLTSEYSDDNKCFSIDVL